jgi:hypothetical protein
MLFCSSSKVNKLVLLRRKLHPVPLCSFKTALVNLAERSTDCFFISYNNFKNIVLKSDFAFLFACLFKNNK